MTTANQLRQTYVDYFVKHGHTRVASSPIVPPDDPTMLFTSAGMVQFKPLYGGAVEPLPYTRATTVQKCLRAGGKGSDLENVGKNLRHHTFFEMLGNFSFGDYFKREAILWGWEFCTSPEYMNLPKERIFATVYGEKNEAGQWIVDDEAEGIWMNETDAPNKVVRLDEKENFWGPAGDTGACGPCSEVKFFMGTEEELKRYRELANSGDEAKIALLANDIVAEGDLFLEIWNMVFPQFDQQVDGSRPTLKYRGIDTGAGLERMTTALQFTETKGAVRTPYETDLLSPIVRAAADIIGVNYRTVSESSDPADVRVRFAINAISDHIRALTFALAEGIVPSNEGRGYVLRRILRRALRFAYLLGKEEPSLYKLVDHVVAVMGDVYPEIKAPAHHAAEVIHIEEERFLRTVAQGTRILDEIIARAKEQNTQTISGSDAFLLHATYGFPVDMTAEIVEDAGLALDREGYAKAMKGHQEEAKKSWKGAALGEEAELLGDIYDQNGETEFRGYETTECEARILAIVQGGKRVEELTPGAEATVILEETPFYGEGGGQVGDRGVIEGENGGSFQVADVQKTPSGIVLHRGQLKTGTLRVSETAMARVDAPRRMATMRNHTVTHLLQAALKKTVGAHITQAGSYVGPDGMRFDFSHVRACTQDELRAVERLVNEAILQDIPVQIDVLPIDEARSRGAIAPFGEKYGHIVRVVNIGEVSMEFCGGTHLNRTGHIGSFRITGESSVAAGIRRIEGVTGLGAYESWAASRDIVADLSRGLSVNEENLSERVGAMQDEIKRLNREIKRVKTSGSAVSLDSLVAGATEIEGLKVIAAKIEGADTDQMRTLADQLRDKVPGSVSVLGAAGDDGKVTIICAVTKDATSRIQAGAVIKKVASIVGGSGGGRPDLAQAGGKLPEKLDEAIAEAPAVIAELLRK